MTSCKTISFDYKFAEDIYEDDSGVRFVGDGKDNFNVNDFIDDLIMALKLSECGKIEWFTDAVDVRGVEMVSAIMQDSRLRKVEGPSSSLVIITLAKNDNRFSLFSEV